MEIREVYPNELSHSVFLAHYGIKGQSWGQRRFQNEDGSLTPAGKKRYSDGGPTRQLSNKPMVGERKKGDPTVHASKGATWHTGDGKTVQPTSGGGGGGGSVEEEEMTDKTLAEMTEEERIAWLKVHGRPVFRREMTFERKTGINSEQRPQMTNTYEAKKVKMKKSQIRR